MIRIAAWTVGGILGLLAVIAIGVHTPPARSFALRQLVSLLRDQNIDFSASALDYNLFSLRVELRNVSVRSTQAPDLPPVFTADRVAADLALRPLLGGAYHVEEAAVDNPRVQVVVDANGRDNLPHPPAGKSSKPVEYRVGHLAINGGSVAFEERRQQINAFLPLDRITMNGEQIRIQAREGRAAYGPRSLAVRGLTGEMQLANGALRIRSFRAAIGDSTFSVAGTVGDQLDLRCEAALALAELSPELQGTVNVVAAVTGPPAQLTATAQVRGQGIRAERFQGVNVAADAAYSGSRVRITSLNVSSPLAAARAQGEIALDQGESSLRFTVERADLERLSALFALPVKIASTGSVTGAAHWPGMRYEEVAGNASIGLRASRAPAKDVLPMDASVEASGTAGRIAIAVHQVQSLGATVAGNLTLTDQNAIGGGLQITAPSLAATAAGAEAFLAKPFGTPIAGSLRSTVNLAGTVSAPQAVVVADVPNLAIGTLHDVTVHAVASYAPDRASIEDATVTWQKQSLGISGAVLPQLGLSAKADRVSVAAILAGLNQADVPASGELSLSAEVTGTMDRPAAVVTLTGANLQAYQEMVGTLAARAQLQDRRLELSELRLDGNGSLRASGSYGLDSEQYRFAAQGQNLRLEQTPVRGVINFQASGDNQAGELKLTADELRTPDREFGRVELTARQTGKQVEFAAAAPKFNATASGRVGMDAPYAATAQVRLADSSFPGVDGTVSAVIDAAGDLQDYRKGTARAEVSKLELKYNGEAVRTDGPLVASYANDTVTVERAAIVAADSRLELSGTLPLDTAGPEGTLRLNGQLNLPGLARFAPPNTGIALQGTASVAGTIQGTLKKLDPTLSVVLENGSVSVEGLTQAVTNANLRGQIRNGALELENASAKWGQATFEATGTVPFALLPADLPVELPRRQGPATLRAELKDVDLAAIEGMKEGLKGKVSVRLEAEAPRPDLKAVKATLTFPALEASLDTYSVAQNGTSEITLENGVARVQRLELTGPATQIQLSGTAALTGDQPLDLRLDAQADASLAAMFASGFRARGATEIHAAVTGPAKQPQAKGYLQVADAQFSVEQPRIGIDGLNLRVDLEGNRATVSKLEGQVNGGTLSGRGSIAYADGKIQESDLAIAAEDLYLDFPTGLKTVSDLRLQLKNIGTGLLLRGTVLVKEGGFTDDLNFDKGILAAATAPRTLETTEERNPLLESIRFNISVVTQDPIVVQNNLAKAQLTAQLVVLGNMYEPGLAGRLVIEEGSELTLQERKYEISRGIITFTNERRIEPSLDLEATTTVSGYDITLRVSGSPGETKTELSSYPVMPEPDIVALLVSGKTLDEVRGQETQVAEAQVLSYLTGRVGGTIGRQVEKATGLSRVRVEPNLIAAETTPSARLTVGQDITRQLQLIYSMDLVNSSDQIYVAEYDLTKRFVTRGVRQSDGSYRFDFRHDLRFGGMAPESRRSKREDRTIGSLTVSGNTYFTKERLLARLKAGPGDRYDFFKLRKGLDRVNQMYTREGLLESNVRLRREQKGSTVNLNLGVEPGPKVEFVFEGASVPGGVQHAVRRVWSSGVFDSQRAEDAVGILRDWLVGDDYLSADIKPLIGTPAEGRKRVVFDIQRGPKYGHVEWVFEGAHDVDGKRLREVIESQKLAKEVYTKPTRVTELLTDFYHETGHLDAAVQNPRYELKRETATGRVVFAVKEGPQYRVGEARFEGNHALTAAALAEAAPLPRGENYRPILRENATDRLRNVYWSHGYNDAVVQAEVVRTPEQARVDLTFRITENAKSVVGEVTVEGNQHTSDNLIRTQLDLKPGDAVDLQKVSNSRRKLYNTGAFAMVEINREDMNAGAADAGSKLVRLRVKVREVQPFTLRYGGFYDTERGPGGIVDLSNQNSLGSARAIGLRARYDSQLQEGRLYFSQPLLTRFPLKTIVSPYVRREVHPETADETAFNVDRLGISVQQQAEFAGRIILNYGYQIEKSRTYDTGPDAIFNVPRRVAGLTTTISRETRDEILDASRGSFLSQAFEFSPKALGSDVGFIKYFGQYFRYFPLQKPRVELFTNQVLRPRLVYATAVRVGLAYGFAEQDVPPSERFLAGGATTLRGFAQDSVRPGGLVGSLGGNGMLVLNNELRFPLVSILDGVGFVDIGNVYSKVSDFSLADVRKSAGFGLRLRTPWILLRLDYGVKLDRRAGESVGRLFFSIGQAF